MSSVYPVQGRSEWIQQQRAPRAVLDLDSTRPHGFFLEQELHSEGQLISSLAILLTNKECPWRCLMCDLWKNTLAYTVPLGAIPTQIDYALERFKVCPEQIKLYNSGSFFDPAAIPTADYQAIAERVSFAKHVVVESHPRLVGKRAIFLRDLLLERNASSPSLPLEERAGERRPFLSTRLEVAMGLETVHPEVLPRLNKKFNLDHFSAAARFLRQEGIGVRAFVLVQPPFLNESEAVEWAMKSAEFAFSSGATVVSLIPTRPGNGAMDRLMEAGEFSRPRFATLEKAMDACLELKGGRVFADTWNLEEFSNCPHCFEARRLRLQELNWKQLARPRIECRACEGF